MTLVHPAGPRTILLHGEGASAEGDQPFLDQLGSGSLDTSASLPRRSVPPSPPAAACQLLGQGARPPSCPLGFR